MNNMIGNINHRCEELTADRYSYIFFSLVVEGHVISFYYQPQFCHSTSFHSLQQQQTPNLPVQLVYQPTESSTE